MPYRPKPPDDWLKMMKYREDVRDIVCPAVDLEITPQITTNAKPGVISPKEKHMDQEPKFDLEKYLESIDPIASIDTTDPVSPPPQPAPVTKPPFESIEIERPQTYRPIALPVERPHPPKFNPLIVLSHSSRTRGSSRYQDEYNKLMQIFCNPEKRNTASLFFELLNKQKTSHPVAAGVTHILEKKKLLDKIAVVTRRTDGGVYIWFEKRTRPRQTRKKKSSQSVTSK